MEKTHKILFFSPHPVEDSGYRYRIQQYIPYLENAGYRCTVWPFSTKKLFQALHSRSELPAKITHTLYCAFRRLVEVTMVGHFDLVVMHREVFPFLMPLMERLVLAQGRPVVFSFDDAIYANHSDLSNLSHAVLYRLKYGPGVDEVLRRSTYIMAGNRILADYARRYNPRVGIFPTVVDCSQYVFRLPDPDTRRVLTIGWIGSPSTATYLTAIVPALRRVAEANPGRVRFRIFGDTTCRLDLPDFAALPFHLETEMRDIFSIDIGLMPMPDTEWTRGKCAFKAIQYMAVGIPSVSSPVGVTTDLVVHGVNGLLANSNEDWFRCLHWLVNDPELRCRIAAAGRNTVEESYSIQMWGPRLASLLTDLLREHPTGLKQPSEAVP